MSATSAFHLGLKSFAAFSRFCSLYKPSYGLVSMIDYLRIFHNNASIMPIFESSLRCNGKNFWTSGLCRFGVAKRKSTSVSAVHFGHGAMGSKRVLSNSSEPEKSEGLAVEVLKSSKTVGLENDVADSNAIQDMMNDPARIEAMTVQQLRATLRRIGIPAKGRKSDLVSTLKSYTNEKTNDERFEAIEQVSSVRVVSSSVTDRDTVESARTVKRSRKSGKQSEDKLRVKLESESATLEQMLQSIKTDKSTGKVSCSKQKVSTEVCKEEVQVVGDVERTITQQPEPWTILAHKKPQKHWVPYNPRNMRPPPLSADTKSVKLMSWNVNGLRALLKLEGFSALELAQREDFDVICLQETKLQEKDVEAIRNTLIDGYENSFWTCSVAKLGYSGTAIVSRIKPLSVKYGLGISDHDSEGRLVTAEFDRFYLLCGYVPNSGDGLRRLPYRTNQWDPSLGSYMKELEKVKPVILTGDLNCAHQEIDIYNPAGNKRSAGFTIEERQSFEANFLSKGFVDTFRRQHPDTVGYTYWGYRHGGRKTNKGWRLDYFLVSESIADNVHDSFILPDVTGSDHSPIGLTLKL